MKLIKSFIAYRLNEASDETITPDDIIESQFADFTCPVAFRLAKKTNRSPQEIATEIASKVKPGLFIKSAHALDGHINITLDRSVIAKYCIEKWQKELNTNKVK